MRRLLLGLVMSITLAVMPVFAQEMRTVTDDAGHEVEIPVHPQRIVSMRGEQIAAPLLELGANIVGSSGRTDAAVNGGKPYVRGAYDALGFRFETSDVKWIGDPNEHDFEAVASVAPDLIIVPDFAADSYDKLSLIAPTLVIKVWGQTMFERYQKIADWADRTQKFDELNARYTDRLERAKALFAETVGDTSKISIAFAEPRKDAIRVNQDYGAISEVIRELGFSQPAIADTAVDGRIDISPELIHEIDADFMVSSYWTGTGSSVTDILRTWDNLLPDWRNQLHAVRNNQYFMIDREEMRAISFQALRTVLEVMVSQIATRDFVPLGVDE